MALMPYSDSPLKRTMKRHMLKWVPGMITCEAFEQFVNDYLDDTLSHAQRRVFQRHLKFCPECVDFLAEYETLRTLVKTSVGNHLLNQLDDAPDDIVAAVINASSADSAC